MQQSNLPAMYVIGVFSFCYMAGSAYCGNRFDEATSAVWWVAFLHAGMVFVLVSELVSRRS